MSMLDFAFRAAFTITLAAALCGCGSGDLPIGPTALGPFSTGVALADFNRDGKPDLLLRVPTRANPQFQLRLGKGDGTFADGTMVAADAGSDRYNVRAPRMDLVDLNGDRRLDVVTSDGKTLTVRFGTS